MAARTSDLRLYLDVIPDPVKVGRILLLEEASVY